MKASLATPAPPPPDLGPDTEIDTNTAARLLRCSQRRVIAMCDEDILKEGRDWWRLPPRGFYRIKRRAISALRLGLQPSL